MLISYSHQFLFVHVPKTAGTSVVRCLRPYAHEPSGYLVNRVLERCGIHVNLLPGPHRWRRFRPHHSAVTIRRHLPSRIFERMFKFAFVRNPWDWLVSYYHFHLQCPKHHRHTYVRRLGSFAEFVRWRVERQRRPQADFLTDRDGRLLVDFLGRYETLHDDFGAICRRLGIQCELEWHNRSERGDYRTYYDDATAALVAEHCRPDIEAFGYTFDGTDTSHSSAVILPFPADHVMQIRPAQGGRAAA
jgi:hypothetical protein